MKRCPQCLFLYPDSDSKCDFDQTPLEHVDDSALEPAPRPRKRRALPIAAAIGLMLGVLVFAVYYGLSRQQQKASAATEPQATVEPLVQPPATTPSPSPEVSPSPSPSIAPSPRSSPEKLSTAAHTRSTGDPVSTSGPGIGTRQGGKPVITLTSGGKIEADEVWRTKDGVWYRRNGMVTLLKRGQVRTIVTR
jgi:cytoskeletal protein RodZ